MGCGVQLLFIFKDHLEKCDYVDELCVNDCGAKFQKRFLQKHLDKDCPKKIISCPYCDDRHLREDKKVGNLMHPLHLSFLSLLLETSLRRTEATDRQTDRHIDKY